MTTPAIAALNNAIWCDAVARSHGLVGQFDADAWTSARRTPALYPDAVTLAADVDATALLERLDASAGCSVKDSFARLDLARFGFRILFDAEWIVLPAAHPVPVPARDDNLTWSTVGSAYELAEWEAAWRGDDGPSGIFLPSLPSDDVVIVAGRESDGTIAAGAAVSRGGGVVGISNVFARTGGSPGAGVVAQVRSLFPGSDIVGYESGNALERARREGFEPVGPLRVWLRDAEWRRPGD